MLFEIIPHQSVGPLQFGMTRPQVHALLPGTPTQFNRGEDTDYYESLGVFVVYDKQEKCVAVELTRPARAFYNGTALLPLSRKAAFDLFSADGTLEKDEAGYTSYLNGLGAYYETSRKAESVIGFAPGYYD